MNSSQATRTLLLLLMTSVSSFAFAQQAGQMRSTAQPGQTPAAGAANGSPAGAAQAGRVPIMNPAQAVQQGVARVPQQPFPPLSAQDQAYVNEVLRVWETRTEKVKRYECKFIRWHFDPRVHPTAHSSIAQGELKFMDPDKGLFKVDQVKSISAKGSTPEYLVDSSQPFGEYWVCDGDWVHILDRNEKKANRIQLPPQMRGKQIHLSPLPFLFGVKASDIQQRYWIRSVPPPAGDDSVWLEAWPKRADDAGNYSRVQVVLHRQEILPRALIVFLPNWRNDQPHRQVYEFTDRQDTAGFWDAVKENVFRQAFIPTKLPADWNVIEEPYIPPQPSAAAGPGAGRVAQPATTVPQIR